VTKIMDLYCSRVTVIVSARSTYVSTVVTYLKEEKHLRRVLFGYIHSVLLLALQNLDSPPLVKAIK
jgi:hypothetical protein